MCKIAFCMFLWYWLIWAFKPFCWKCLLLFIFFNGVVFIFVRGLFFNPCWSCPRYAQCCLCLCCPIAVNSVCSVAICWSDECCPVWTELCDIRSIKCLLWYIGICSLLLMNSPPLGSFFNPVVSCCCWSVLSVGITVDVGRSVRQCMACQLASCTCVLLLVLCFVVSPLILVDLFLWVLALLLLVLVVWSQVRL